MGEVITRHSLRPLYFEMALCGTNLDATGVARPRSRAFRSRAFRSLAFRSLAFRSLAFPWLFDN
jgi:hypothetical protein